MKKTIIITNLILGFLFFTINIFAQEDGTLDATFGTDGVVNTNIEISGITQIKLLPDNEILALVENDTSNIVIKFNADGSVDNSFGTAGKLYLISSNKSNNLGRITFDVLSNGKIIITENIKETSLVHVTGKPDSIDVKISAAVIKFNSNGSIDQSFAENGFLWVYKYEERFEYHSSSYNSYLLDVKVRNDDSFLVLGKHFEVYETKCYNSDGSPNQNFTELTKDTPQNEHIILDNKNNFYVIEGLSNGLHIKKYNDNGNVDFSYGNSGETVIDTNYLSNYRPLESIRHNVDAKNNLFILRNPVEDRWVIVSEICKIKENGKLDTNFGVNGIRTISRNEMGSTEALYSRNIFPMVDGNIIFAGGEVDLGSDMLLRNIISFFVGKLNSNGSFNNSFGRNGYVFNNSFEKDATYWYSRKYRVDMSNSTKKIYVGYEKADTLYLVRYNNSRSYSSLHVSGDVSGTWEVDTVYVDGDITVPLNKTLTIAPATTVLFTGKYLFLVNGQLIAEGTEKEVIHFTSVDSVLWRGIIIKNTNVTKQPTSLIKYCDLTKVGGGTWTNVVFGTLRFDNSEADVSNIFIHNSYGLNFKKATGVITKSYLKNTSPLWMDSTTASFTISNTHFDSSAVSLYNSSPNIDSCIIERAVNGGSVVGIYGSNSSPKITNTIIRSNGGGVYFNNNSAPIFEFVTIEDNETNNYGGGGYFGNSTPTLKNVIIKGNTTAQYGGGLFFTSTNSDPTVYTATLNNCLIVKNKVRNTQNSGGGVTFWNNTKGEFTNCTIADNEAKDWAGIQTDNYSKAYLKNCIVWNNGNNLDFQAGGFYNYSIIQGNYVGEDTAKTNLKNINPLFRDAAAGDYHLQSTTCGSSANSPAIDAGDPNINDFLLDCATAGLGSNHADIGAYGGANNWWDKSVMPSCYYQGEVSGIWDCDTIKVIGDITVPEGDSLIITKNVESVYVKGPYQIRIKGTLIAIGPENAHIGLGSNYIYFRGTKWHGIFFDNLNGKQQGTSLIENCRFDYADKTDIDYQGGGAIAIYNSDNVIIKHSVFYSNNAKLGGAMYIENSSPQIVDCQFEQNGHRSTQILTVSGGAMYVKNGNPLLHRLKFISNFSQSGGAIVLDNSSPVISNNLIVKNYAKGLGGAIHLIKGASPQIINLTVADNLAGTSGAALYLNPNSNPTIINTILYGNTKPEIYVSNNSTPVVTYSLVQAGQGESYFGTGCLDADPLFKKTGGNYYYLKSKGCGDGITSPAVDGGHPDSLDTKLNCYEGLGTTRADMGYYGGRYSDNITDVAEKNNGNEIPNRFALLQNYPNPFNPSTTINYSIPLNVNRESSIVTLKVYDILGREVATLVNKEQAPGNYSVKFDASNLSSGLYFYRISVGNFVDVKKMMLLK